MTCRLFIFATLIIFNNTAWAQKTLNIFTCEPEWQALAEQIGGKHIQASSATTAFQDPHHIQARPSLIAKTRRADLIFCTGSDLEVGWLPLLLRKAGNDQVMPGQIGYFLAADHVEQIEVPVQLDRAHGDVHADGNPHIHLSPARIAQVADALAHTLIQLAPSNKAVFQTLNDNFQQKWKTATEDWRQQAAPLVGKKAVVYHKDWSYLLEWLQMTAVADLEPKPGIPPTSAHLAKLLTIVETEKPAFILVAAHRDERPAHWLSKRTGVPVVKLPYTVGGNAAAKDLFSLYDSTISLLLTHLPKKPSATGQTSSTQENETAHSAGGATHAH